MRTIRLLPVSCAAALGLASLSCSSEDSLPSSTGTPPADPPGALVQVSMPSRVGVLLEDFPAAQRDRIATEILAKPESFWVERAKWQLRLTSVRLVYRKYYFDESEWDLKNALPLPPEEKWSITLDAAGPTRTTVDGHDVIAVGYTLDATLLTDLASPGVSEPALATVGGHWDEAFFLPLDPTLLLQRTGFACLSEDQFPAESLDAEDAFRFYDDTCEVETLGEQSCHLTEPLPTESCTDAVTNAVGHVDATLSFDRIAWDAAAADAARHAPPTTPDAPDLEVLTTGEGLNDNRVIYRYIPEDHCAIADGCVGGSGWRRLLVFDSHDHNVGGAPLEIGPVDYYGEGIGGELIEHNVYTFSACHEHYHFQHYGNFSFGSDQSARIQKNGFCIESTDRLSNHESAPLYSDYICENQGVSAGWGDLYGSSLTCNWVDITDLDTSAAPVTGNLVFHSNPDGFLCEGTLVKDEQGNQVWESTEFVTEDGLPVNRPVCEQTPGTEENDIGTVEVTIPRRGGFVTSPCRHEHDLGPRRNCDFATDGTVTTCTAGETVTLTCAGGEAARPQVVRVCEASAVLGGGVDCTFNDALTSSVVEGAGAEVTFTCPTARDASEPGGQYAIYTAPVWGPDGAVSITCAP